MCGLHSHATYINVGTGFEIFEELVFTCRLYREDSGNILRRERGFNVSGEHDYRAKGKGSRSSLSEEHSPVQTLPCSQSG
ncbi:Hypothetical protein NTJ_14409 [Nesidiocoris tenuis]|uniref:ZP domain-containing protein n=1 Tax=Nesidiocoris tenuis TaxID=355587 RepID=A0ABN7BB17_9HEMI|nr:Hypothetical protein NTJ_14409 [Nesidiocoris tenuis]